MGYSCTPESLSHAISGARVMVKTHRAEDRQAEWQGLELVGLSKPIKPQVLAVHRHYSNMEVGILEVHVGQPQV